MSSTNTSQQLKAGVLVDDRYQILDLIGSGGFANVYRARHVHLNRDVAIKVLHPPLSGASSHDAPFSKRFEQEAQIAAALDHPNIVGIFDYGFLPTDEPFIAMSLLDGHDLEEELTRKTQIAPDRALRLMKGCVEGVAHGHAKGIVHKDLKPSNLFLVSPDTREERLVVLDFGIARVFNDPESKITQSGLFSGTPAYLAPEYVREQSVSPALDVYQLGLILIEMLTGRPAVEAEGPMGYLLAHCMGRLAVGDELFQGSLGAVLKKAVAVRPEERYPNAAAFADALGAADASSLSVAYSQRAAGPARISQEEVEAFASTLPESFLTDTAEWSAKVSEPRMTPGEEGGTLDGYAPKPPSSGPSEADPDATVPESPAPERSGPGPTVATEMEAPRGARTKLVVFGIVALFMIVGVSVAAALLHDDSPTKPAAQQEPESSVEEIPAEGFIVAPEEIEIPEEAGEDATNEEAMAVATDAAQRYLLLGQRTAEFEATRAGAALERKRAKTKRPTRKPTVTRPKPKPAPKPKPKPAPKPKPKPAETESGSDSRPMLIGH